MRPDWVIQPAQPLAPGVVALTVCRTGPGQSQGPHARCNLGTGSDAPAAVAANRAEVQAALSLPSAPRWLRQVHGTDVVDLDRDHRDQPAADGAMTRRHGVVAAILTADCLPILIAARDGSAVAALHAGWRGLAAGVIESGVRALALPGQDLSVWLGPAISGPAYEVGIEVREALVAQSAAAAAAFVPTRPGHWHCDLYALARLRLRALGIQRSQGGTHCTHGDATRYFSYRRDGVCGRMASLIWITAPGS